MKYIRNGKPINNVHKCVLAHSYSEHRRYLALIVSKRTAIPPHQWHFLMLPLQDLFHGARIFPYVCLLAMTNLQEPLALSTLVT